VMQEIRKRASYHVLTQRYNVSTRILQRMANKDHDEALMVTDPKRKKARQVTYSEIEQAVVRSTQLLRNHGEAITKESIQSIAFDHANLVLSNPNTEDSFKEKYSNARSGKSWLHSFAKRQCFRKVRINGDGADLQDVDTSSLETICSRIVDLGLSAKDVFNFDESSLFYTARPVYTMAQHGHSGAGSKSDKTRITLMVGMNGNGSARLLSIIGKCKTPRGTNQGFSSRLEVRYYNNKRAWITRELFTKTMIEFDFKLSSKKNVLLDSSLVYKLWKEPHSLGLKSIFCLLISLLYCNH
jgi:DDE superfamily endonuclease